MIVYTTLNWFVALVFSRPLNRAARNLCIYQFKMPKMYEALIMSITCYEKRRRRKYLCTNRSKWWMVRLSNVVHVYDAMNCTRNQSVLRVIFDHFKPKMVECEFEQRFGICVKSLRHGYVTFWNVCWEAARVLIVCEISYQLKTIGHKSYQRHHHHQWSTR